MGNNLCIRIGMEDCAFELQLFFQFQRIYQSTIKSQCHASFDMANNQWLCICTLRIACAVQNMTYCHSAAAQIAQHTLIKGIRYKTQITVRSDDTIIVDSNTTALLTSVLKSIKCHIGVSDNTGCAFRRVYTKNATLFMNLIKHQKVPFPIHTNQFCFSKLKTVLTSLFLLHIRLQTFFEAGLKQTLLTLIIRQEVS